jgi:hypothetical protein
MQIFLQNREIMLTQKFLFRSPMGPLGGHFLRGKFFETDLAENFTIDADCIEWSILKFLEVLLILFERYLLITA